MGVGGKNYKRDMSKIEVNERVGGRRRRDAR